MPKHNIKIMASNKKAFHEYEIKETFETGIVLTGTEIKSIRQGKVNLKESYARVFKGEVWIYGMHIAPFEQGNRFNHDEYRHRKLLLNKAEIRKLIGQTAVEGYTLVPIRLYLKNGFAKLEIGLARGKQMHDKRQSLKERDHKREIEKAFMRNQKGY